MTLHGAETRQLSRRKRETGVVGWLASVECRDKEDVIAGLELVRLLALELPVGIVDEHQHTRTAVALDS